MIIQHSHDEKGDEQEDGGEEDDEDDGRKKTTKIGGPGAGAAGSRLRRLLFSLSIGVRMYSTK